MRHKHRAEVWHDIGYALTAHLAEDGTAVEVTLRRPGGVPVLTGTIRIDGCGSLRTPSPEGMTLCGFDQIRLLQLAMLRMWGVARDMLGGSIRPAAGTKP